MKTNFNTDFPTITTSAQVAPPADDDGIGQAASDLARAVSGQAWVAAALALVMLVLALLKKFGVIGKPSAPVLPPPEEKPDESAAKSADRARALLSKYKEKRDE